MLTYAWVKVFRIIPEFRILRLTFYRKSASKSRIREIKNSFSDLFSVCLQAIGHLNLICEYFVGILQVLRLEFRKFRILEILNFHPCLRSFCDSVKGRCVVLFGVGALGYDCYISNKNH